MPLVVIVKLHYTETRKVVIEEEGSLFLAMLTAERKVWQDEAKSPSVGPEVKLNDVCAVEVVSE